MSRHIVLLLLVLLLSLAGGYSGNEDAGVAAPNGVTKKCQIKYKVCCHQKYVCGHYKKEYSIVPKYCTKYGCTKEMYKDA